MTFLPVPEACWSALRAILAVPKTKNPLGPVPVEFREWTSWLSACPLLHMLPPLTFCLLEVIHIFDVRGLLFCSFDSCEFRDFFCFAFISIKIQCSVLPFEAMLMSRVHAATEGHFGVCGPAVAWARVDFCDLCYHQRPCRALWSM